MMNVQQFKGVWSPIKAEAYVKNGTDFPYSCEYLDESVCRPEPKHVEDDESP
jgi:hypothetical protein